PTEDSRIPPAPPPRQAMTTDERLAAILPHLAALAAAGEPLDVALLLNGSQVRLTVAGQNAQADCQVHVPLSPTMKRIVEVLRAADRPLKGGAVAARAGKNYCGYFRTALTECVRRGVALLLDDGYWLADANRPAPTPQAGQVEGRAERPLTDDELAQRIAAARADKASRNGHTEDR